jgi:hypothetical protein
MKTKATRRMRLIAHLYLLFATVILLQDARAQSLWGPAEIGMSPSKVAYLIPEAIPVSEADRQKVNSPEAVESLRIRQTTLGGLPASVHFFFKGERLAWIHWRLIDRHDVSTAIPAYEAGLSSARDQYPAVVSGAKSERKTWPGPIDPSKATWDDWVHKKNMTTQYSHTDEWDTAEGVHVSMKLDGDSNAAQIRLWVSGDGPSGSNQGGAWGRLMEREQKQRRDQAEALAAFESLHQAKAAQLKREQQVARRKAEDNAYEAHLSSWIGRNISDLAARWGAPTGTTNLPNGQSIYLWQVQTGGLQCRTSIFAGKDGAIVHWQWTGNACRVSPSEERLKNAAPQTRKAKPALSM